MNSHIPGAWTCGGTPVRGWIWGRRLAAGSGISYTVEYPHPIDQEHEIRFFNFTFNVSFESIFLLYRKGLTMD